MANSKAQQYEIIKNSELCLNKFDADIVQFGNGFNKKNSPVLGGAISNMFYYTDPEDPEDKYKKYNYDSNGKHEIWINKDGKLYIDGNNTDIIKTQRKFVDNVVSDKDYIEYANSSNYIYKENNKAYCVLSNANPVEMSDYTENIDYKLVQIDETSYFAISIDKQVTAGIITQYGQYIITAYGIELNPVANPDNSFTIPATFEEFVNGKVIARAGKLSNNDKFFYIDIVDQNNVRSAGRGYYKIANNNYFYGINGHTVERFIRTPFIISSLHGTIFAIYREGRESISSAITSWSIAYCLLPKVTIDARGYFIELEESDDAKIIDLFDSNGFMIYRNSCNYGGDRIFFLRGDYQPLRVHSFDGIYNGTVKNYIYYSVNGRESLEYLTIGDFKYKSIKRGSGTETTEYNIGLFLPLFNKRLRMFNNFNILLDENNLPQSFSYSAEENDLGALILPFGIIDNTKNYFVGNQNISYYNAYDNKWHVISIENGLEIKLFDKYVLFNTTDQVNAYDIEEQRDAIWANDWNNRLGFLSETNITDSDFYIEFSNIFNSEDNEYQIKYASAFNYSRSRIGIPSSFLPTTTTKIKGIIYLNSRYEVKASLNAMPYLLYNMDASHNNALYDIDIYLNDVYSFSIKCQNNEMYRNVLYDGLWDNISWYTPAITMKFTETYANVNTVSFFDIIYRLSLSGNDENRNILLYDIDSQYRNIEEFFTIQGQSYFIQNNKIYKYDLIDNEFANQTFVKDITGIEYLCNSSLCAFFWSKTDSSIYSFTADNVLNKLYYTTDISEVYDAEYYPSIDMIVMLTDYGLIFSRDTTGMFILNDVNSGSLFLHKDGYVVHYDNDRVTYWSLRPVDTDWDKKDIEFSTKYYGLGSNLISISDTWYLRLFADKDEYEDYGYPRNGNIILSVDALTDKGMSTEEKIIPVKESDWDKLTNTLYIRFQPKLQRAVGISLSVKSPFAVGYIGVSSIPETTQMSKPSLQV